MPHNLPDPDQKPAFGGFFSARASQRLGNAASLLAVQTQSLLTPYYSDSYQASALIYPLSNFFNALKALTRIAVDLFLFLPALVIQPSKNIPNLLTCLFMEIATLIISALNVALALISLVSRTLVSCLMHYQDVSAFIRQIDKQSEAKRVLSIAEKTSPSKHLDKQLREGAVELAILKEQNSELDLGKGAEDQIHELSMEPVYNTFMP